MERDFRFKIEEYPNAAICDVDTDEGVEVEEWLKAIT